MTVLLSNNWDDVCSARMGVAQLTRMAFDGADLKPLWQELMQKASDDKAGAGMAMDLSVIAQLLGDKATGLSIQTDTMAHQRLYRSPCATARPRLRVLAFAAVTDIGGNTPLEFLLQGSDIELATYYVVPGIALPSPMPDHDVAIIAVPDGAAMQDTLATIEALIPTWPRPVLNPPGGIRTLDRDRLFQRLSGILGLEIPKTVRLARESLVALAGGQVPLAEIMEDGAWPLIVRPTGSHAGFGLHQVGDAAALAAYLEERAEETFFLSRFVNYASDDGAFRKYRVVMVDGKAYACHMAIAEEWKVWYLNADMALSVANRLEEAVFMRSFDASFAKRHDGALREMAARIGLDYFTIDCAETRAGDLLIFEADNSAIVHDMDPPNIYPYKSPQMRKIFAAVEAMFFKHAVDARTDKAKASAA